jgi:hypothetical protein
MSDDYNTQIAQVRALVGDMDSQWFADEELTAYLTIYNGNVLRASGLALQNLAITFAVKARSIKTDDLAIDTRARATALSDLSKQYFAQADSQDQNDSADMFQLVQPSNVAGPGPIFLSRTRQDLVEDPSNPGYLFI